MDNLVVLIFVLLVVAVWTLVGHGIWVFCVWVFRTLGGSPGAASPPTTDRVCPSCGLPLERPPCGVCHWPLAADPARPRSKEALAAISAQVERFGQLGVLDDAACQRLQQMLADEQRQILAPRTIEPAQAAAAEPEKIITARLVPEPQSAPPPVATPPAEPEADERERAAEQGAVERAAAFAAKPPSASPPATEQPSAPARAWTDWLAAFMEERNIRWGELVGGLLIVCGSIALVVSFWSAIEQQPWLKFLLFNGVTAALFGVGFYSEHRWRLRTTSQGLLTIGCLLVPLNFLAIAALSSAPGRNGWPTIAGELFSAGLFAVLVYYAGRILVGREAIALALGLLVPSLAQLLVRRFIDPSAGGAMLVSIAALPVGCYLGVNFWTLRRAATGPEPDEQRVNALFKFLGMTSFAVVLPIALLLYRSGHPIEALRQLPALAGLLGFVPLCAGLLLWQKLAGRVELAALRTAGMTVAAGGALVSLGGIVVAWPEPAAMLPAALVEFAIFTFVAWRFRLPAVHVVAAPCLAVAYSLGAHLLGGQIEAWGSGARRVADVLVSGRSGVLLAPLVLAYAAAAFFAHLRGLGSRLPLGAAAGGLATVSVALVSWFGFAVEGDPLGAAWVYLLYAVCLLAVAARQRHPAFAWLGSALLLASLVQEIVFGYGGVLGLVRPEVTAILVYCTLTAAIAAAVRALDVAIEESRLAEVSWHASFFVSLVAAAWLVGLIPQQVATFEMIHWAWLAALWAAAALAIGWLPVWTMVQAALVLATGFGAWSQLERQTWFAASPRAWLDPWTLQALGVALVGLNLVWAAARIACRRLAGRAEPSRWSLQAQRLFASPWLSVDRATTTALVVLLVLLGTTAVLPGVFAEIAPRDATAGPLVEFGRLGIEHQHAGGWGSWLLLCGSLVLLAAVLRDRMSMPWLACLFVAAAVSIPLVASRFESQLAVASALHWSSAAWLLAASALIWSRGAIGQLAAGWGWQPLANNARARNDITALVLTLGLAAPAALATTIGLQALARAEQMAGLPGDSFGLAILLAVALILYAALPTGAWRLLVGRDGPAWPSLTWGHAAGQVLVATPLVSLAIYRVARVLEASPIVGPAAGSIFHRLGPAISCAVPIGVIALVLVGYALRERSSRFGLAGGLACNLAASLAFLLTVSASGLTFDTAAWLRLAQLNAAVAATYSLAWTGLNAWQRRRGGRAEPMTLDFPLLLQAAVAPAISTLALGWAWLRLVRFPTGVAPTRIPVLPELADAFGWLSFATACASVLAIATAAGKRLGAFAASSMLVALAILTAGVAAQWDTGDWLAFNTLLTGHGAIAVGLMAAAWVGARTLRGQAAASDDAEPAAPPSGAMWVVIQAAVIVLLAFRELAANEWWSVGGFALLGVVLAPALAWVYQRRRYLYLAAPFVNLAATLALSKLNVISTGREFFYWNLILLALPAPVWLLIELGSIRLRRFRPLVEATPAHRVAARLGVALLALTTGAMLIADWTGNPQPAVPLGLDWLAWLATLVAAVACLWDVRAKDSVALPYALGLVACGILLDGFDLAPDWLLWTGTMVLAAYALATSYLWSRRRGLAAISRSLGVPRRAETEFAELSWLVPANVALVSLVVLLTFFVELTNRDLAQRVLASQAALVQVASLALLARGDRRGVLQLGALALGAVGAVMFGWAWLEVGTTFTWLHALTVVAAATAGVGALYGLGLTKLLGEASDWLAPARRLTPVLAAASVAAVAVTLGIEIYQFASFGEVNIAGPAIVVLAVALAGLAFAAMAAAVLPGRDPLGLSERGRTVYVYAAEVILALLFVHIRVTLPWLFTGFFQQFWPLIVMGIAYLGVGAAELFRRRQQHVLAKPLENTGALLPVLPVIGYWASNSRVDYSLLLLAVGVMYAGLSIARRSFGFGLLAALAANGGLWFFLGRQDGWGFLAHPQVWLIPPAVCVLAAAYLNRRQLNEAQMTSIRYTSSMAIYISSTADIFINGVANAPWLPLVLAGLSIAGILAGIMLRVRAFLFLGTGFLALALFTIIWYAAEDLEQTWIWYASVIALGVMILTLFAVFEKKRQEVLELFEQLKQWEA